jgi:dolichol-phosphate mannosyltransferase
MELRDGRGANDRGTASADQPGLSVIVPVYNEVESLPHLKIGLLAALDALDRSYEVVFVNDGSSDGSSEALAEMARERSEIKVVNFRRNFGQTAAMMAGIDFSRGEIIVTLDADLQNDPLDIALLLDTLDQGYDVVSGWRKHRQDAAVTRNLPSRIANWVISRVSGVSLHDYGCTLKAYRRNVLDGVRLYGEMHRFVPIYANWTGARVKEIPVRHHARRFGKSKYGLQRTFKVVLDLLVVKFLSKYLVKPIYVFGGFGLLTIFASFLSAAAMIVLKVFYGVSMILTPLPVLSSMLFLVGAMSVLMGLLAEIMSRTYFESQSRRSYVVRDTINLPRRSD